jgi:phosphate acetyltransferase
VGGVRKTLEELVDSLYLAYDSFKVKDVEVLAIIANKVQLENIKLVTDGLRSSLPTETLVNAIPLVSSLNNPTIKEIVDELDAKVLFWSRILK